MSTCKTVSIPSFDICRSTEFVVSSLEVVLFESGRLCSETQSISDVVLGVARPATRAVGRTRLPLVRTPMMDGASSLFMDILSFEGALLGRPCSEPSRPLDRCCSLFLPYVLILALISRSGLSREIVLVLCSTSGDDASDFTAEIDALVMDLDVSRA